MSAASVQYTSHDDTRKGKARQSARTLVRNFQIPGELQRELDASKLHAKSKLVILWLAYQSLVGRRDTSRMQCLSQQLLDAAVGSQERRKIVRFIAASKVLRRVPKWRAMRGERSLAYEVRPTYFSSNRRANITNEEEMWVGVSVEFGVLVERLVVVWRELGWCVSRMCECWGLECLDGSEIHDVVFDSVSAGGFELRRSIERFSNDDARLNVFRAIDGRSFHCVTLLPKDVRRSLVRFGGLEAAECDVRACWPWLIAIETRRYLGARGLDCSRVDLLIELIESGRLYSSLVAIAEEFVDSVEVAKREFARQCLFGRLEHHPLWFAMVAICPEFCATVKYYRHQMQGASRLYSHLARQEGTLLWRAMLLLAADRIPAVRIHDGALVPQGSEQMMAEYLKRVAMQRFGRAPFVKLA